MLSIGHSSLTQYCQLFLAGYGVEVDDLAALRTEGSLTPGHPEFGHTAGVECTTGPLGAGVADAVGFAMAARRERALLDPATPLGESSIFDRTIYCIAGDGCMQEGVSGEASSLAGAQKLGNLILFYDDNRISIEGDTKIAFTEDVAARYAAYGWHVQHVDWTNGGTCDTFARWIAAAIDTHAARTPRQRAAKAHPRGRAEERTGSTRSFSIAVDTMTRMRAAITADQHAGRWPSDSAWCGEAISLAVSAAANNDLALMQGAMLYFAGITVVINLLVDLLYKVVDPRVVLK